MKRLFVAALLLSGCIEYETKAIDDNLPPDPRILVEPESIDFGDRQEDETVVEAVTVTSAGGSSLSLDRIGLEGSGAFTLLTDVTGALLEPGDSVDIDIAFSPLAPDDEGMLHISSNALNLPEAFVPLNGRGMIPQLTLDPEQVDFGYVSPGDVATETVMMINTGGEVLTIDAIASAGYPFDGFATLPVDLAPGESAELTVTFSPLENGFYDGGIWIASNSPGPDRLLPLTGTSEEQPVAICSVEPTPVHTLYDRATFVGEDSYDPAGAALTYAWTMISRPSGSQATMPSGAATDPNRRNFLSDVAGDYVAQLIVTNEFGVSSDACLVTLHSEPLQDLWVEMYWTHSNDDMDLHLLAPGGVLTSGTDCYYANCTGRGLDWGVTGAREDNPTLDIDDIPGTGPENINIAAPQTGTFTVYVHDYPGSVYRQGNDVTVNIYLSGVLVWTGMKTISDESDYVPFAEIVWPDQTVNPL